MSLRSPKPATEPPAAPGINPRHSNDDCKISFKLRQQSYTASYANSYTVYAWFIAIKQLSNPSHPVTTTDIIITKSEGHLMGKIGKVSPYRLGASIKTVKHQLLSILRRLFEGRVFSPLDCL